MVAVRGGTPQPVDTGRAAFLSFGGPASCSTKVMEELYGRKNDT